MHSQIRPLQAAGETLSVAEEGCLPLHLEEAVTGAEADTLSLRRLNCVTQAKAPRPFPVGRCQFPARNSVTGCRKIPVN